MYCYGTFWGAAFESSTYKISNFTIWTFVPVQTLGMCINIKTAFLNIDQSYVNCVKGKNKNYRKQESIVQGLLQRDEK